MRLLEFDNPLRSGIVSVLTRLSDKISSGKVKSDWTIDELMTYLSHRGIVGIDEDLFIKLIKNKKPPFYTFIKNISDGKIEWAGHKTASTKKSEDPKKIVKSLAKKAVKSK